VKFNSFLALLFTTIAILILLYGLIAELLDIVVFSSDCSRFALLMFPDEDKVDAEVGKGNLVRLIIVNAGSYTDNYDIAIEGPEWTIIKPTSFRLKPEESKTLFLYVSPEFGIEGKHLVKVNADSKCISSTKTIEVNVLQN
jgi:hypothetical protein